MNDTSLGITPEDLHEMIRDPVIFAERVFGLELFDWQKVFMRDVANPSTRRIAVKAPHGVGKSLACSVLAWWALMMNVDSVVLVVAPTLSQAKGIIRAEMARLAKMAKGGILDKLFAIQDAQVVSKASPKSHFLLFRSPEVTGTRDGTKTVEGLQGFHAKQIIAIIDEASGVDDAIFEVCEGYLATGDAKIIAISNPTRPYGKFFRAFHADSDLWSTHSVTYTESPLVNRDWAEGLIKKYGRDHNVVRVRVIGDFPLHAEDALLGLADLEKAYSAVPDDSFTTRVMGADPARFGSDSSVIAFARGSDVQRLSKYHGLDIPGFAAMIEVEAQGFKPEYVVVDCDGVGAGVYDILKRSQVLRDIGCRALSYQGSTSPVNKKQYHNRRAELLFKFRDAVRTGNTRLPEDENLEIQATSLKFKFTEKSKILIERKEDFKRRLGMSPDELDASAYALMPYLYKRGDANIGVERRNVAALFARGAGLLGVREVLW